MTICVVGSGAWGTALAVALHRAGRSVRLWGRDVDTVAALAGGRGNPRYLPGIALPALDATQDLVRAAAGAKIVLLVVPVAATETVARAVLDAAPKNVKVVCCSKGMDLETGDMPSRIVRRLLPDATVAALSGPSFAVDVAQGLPTAVTLAAETLPTARRLAEDLATPSLRLYANDDLVGVELGGALKNVMAIAVGVARGLELGASAEAAVIARGFDELGRIATALGARPETLNGLSGLGDLVLSCSHEQSRNFSYGMAVGRGEPLTGLKLAEGVRTAGVAAGIARERELDCALVEGVDALLKGAVEPRTLVSELLRRPLKAEV